MKNEFFDFFLMTRSIYITISNSHYNLNDNNYKQSERKKNVALAAIFFRVVSIF